MWGILTLILSSALITTLQFKNEQVVENHQVLHTEKKIVETHYVKMEKEMKEVKEEAVKATEDIVSNTIGVKNTANAIFNWGS